MRFSIAHNGAGGSSRPEALPLYLIYDMILSRAKLDAGGFSLTRMLIVPPPARDIEWLKRMVQFAVQLEFATIPPYLTAFWSIKTSTTSPAPFIILPIVLQEMLHMGIMCNLQNSLGSAPLIADPNVVPTYPGHLPGGVHPDLRVSLRPFSKELLADTFMPIEAPEPGSVTYSRGQTYPTIGAFYTAIADCIHALGEEIFTGERQIELDRADFRLAAINTRADALAGIDLIKGQGEGTAASPLYGPNPDDIAHYFLFGELYHERLLVQLPDGHWDYSGDALPLPDPGDIYPMAPVPSGGYPESRAFDQLYSQMLRELEGTWRVGGDEGKALFTSAQESMGLLGAEAIKLMATPIPGSSLNFGPDFRYIAQDT